ncbi:MFS transporter [Dongia rigui]|uniref:MFS transporter n=1 Tax=Dongia rigui TaxID=940149 RepID=A0ABU5DTG7_9PROT|nr:MFS transporter [Dongia rigui]MDY0870610.1 MFS transporter [Dongia rigui]
MTATTDTDFQDVARREERAARRVLLTISFCHMLNDMMQSLLLAIYPMLKAGFSLSFGQIGLITLTFQITASLLQPLIGMYTDRSPKNFSLSVGMSFTLVGLLLLAFASSYPMVLVAAALVGMGSSVFHPESSRIARLASGGRHGFAQSLFQVGGNVGSAIGPLVAAYAIAPHGQSSVGWFSLAALLAVILLATVGQWYKAHRASRAKRPAPVVTNRLPRNKVFLAIAVLLGLLFSKYFYMASISSYYTFYLIDHFGVAMQDAQVYLFIFLGSAALGTILGGPIGDRIGPQRVIWGSILGVLPFTLVLPHVGLTWTIVLTVPIGLILSSAFAAIVVYGQELIPGKVGMVAGLFFGFAFGMGGVGAAVLGKLADATSITFVYQLCAFLPALGLLAVFLPNVAGRRRG